MVLISSSEVIELAFSSFEHISDWIIKEAKIEATQETYLRPVFGHMYDQMQAGKYADFVHELIKPALAHYVRMGMIPDLSMKLGNSGLMQPYNDYSKPSSDKQRALSIDQAKKDGDALLRKAIREVENHPELYPEYEKTGNIKRQTLFKGGLIV